MNANINNTISGYEMFADLESLIDNRETLHQCWLNDMLSSASLNWGGGLWRTAHVFGWVKTGEAADTPQQNAWLCLKVDTPRTSHRQSICSEDYFCID